MLFVHSSLNASSFFQFHTSASAVDLCIPSATGAALDCAAAAAPLGAASVFDVAVVVVAVVALSAAVAIRRRELGDDLAYLFFIFLFVRPSCPAWPSFLSAGHP